MQITLDEGYQFGLGVFETIAVEKRDPVLLSWHLERLNLSLRALGIVRSVTSDDVLEYLKGQDAEHHALKIMVSGQNVVFTLRPNHYVQEQYERGFRLAFSHVYRNETSPLVCHKTMNYGDCILEKRRASSLGADELIFKNSRGELCEGTISNLFFVKNGEILTPPVSCGLLPGILRRFVLKHFQAKEVILHEEDTAQMDECFVTNSLMGIMPVHSFQDKIFTDRAVTGQCMKEYREYLRVNTPG